MTVSYLESCGTLPSPKRWAKQVGKKSCTSYSHALQHHCLYSDYILQTAFLKVTLIHQIRPEKWARNAQNSWLGSHFALQRFPNIPNLSMIAVIDIKCNCQWKEDLHDQKYEGRHWHVTGFLLETTLKQWIKVLVSKCKSNWLNLAILRKNSNMCLSMC